MGRIHKRRQDRLSSLPDAILVEILSCLPLNSAIITDTLSKRWRHLWTQITSVNLDHSIINAKRDFFNSLDYSLHKLASPSTDTFVIDIPAVELSPWIIPELMSLLSQRCRRDPRHLTIFLPAYIDFRYQIFELQWPPCIFKTRSLVSIELKSTIPLSNSDEIELPNLKRLSVDINCSCGWLTKLVESCPLLEDLSLKFTFISNGAAVDLNCSCPNLKRLSIYLGLKGLCNVVINAPKLEYLKSRVVPSTTTVCIGHEPFSLHEARLGFLDCVLPHSNDVEGCLLEYYNTVSNVRNLTLNSNALKTFTTFPNLTRLTLNVDFYCYNFKTVTQFLELCPVLEVLTLSFNITAMLGDTKWRNIPRIRSLEHVKKIEIVVGHIDYELEKHFAGLISYLLKQSLVLERFCFRVIPRTFLKVRDVKEIDRRYPRSEYKLCDLLYNCPRASMYCEILFNGSFYSMSRKAGSNVFRPVAIEDFRLFFN